MTNSSLTDGPSLTETRPLPSPTPPGIGTASTHLFLAIPNNCGSTLAARLISQSEHVATLGAEGQHVPGFAGPIPRERGNALLFTRQLDELQDERFYDWPTIQELWNARWERTPGALIRMEKSPPNIARIEMLRDNFPNACFVISWRNPYAQVEGIMRGRRGTIGATTAAWHALSCLDLARRALFIPVSQTRMSYERICENPNRLITQVSEMVRVQLPPIDPDAPIKIKGRLWNGIRSTNDEQIERLDPRDVRVISEIFKTRRDLFKYFDYEIL